MTKPAQAPGEVTLNDFVIIKLSGVWTITRDGIILSQRPSSSEAIQTAITMADGTAGTGEYVRVILEEGGTRRVLWDSYRKGEQT